MSRRAAPPATAVTAALLLLAGCGAVGFVEPELREGQWRPTGANEANLRLMVDRPEDLRRGREATGRADGHVAGAAVERQRAGQIRPLPEINTAPSVRSGGG